ncbi:hypothetical protein BGX34_006153, partial [Mortierella sp. NVP85]
LFELRVIRPLGLAVNIIFNIARRIKWFFLIFAVFLVSFTHSLLYVLHTRRYRPCEGKEACKEIDYPSSYPTDFSKALGVTYFFLAGRYDPVDNTFDNGPTSFRFMMIIFYFCTSIILLNVLIALMNDAFNASEREGKTAYWRLVSEVLAEMEMLYNKDAGNNDGYSEYIYYCATDEEVREFESRFMSHAESSKEAHEVIHKTQSRILEDVKAVGEAVRSSSQQVIEGFKAHAGDPDGKMKEPTETRAHVKHPCCGQVEQELTQLKELVNNLVLHLQANNPAS